MAKGTAERCDTIEECYERMLAYAAKGLPHEGSEPATEIRATLTRAAAAIGGLAGCCAAEAEGREPADRYRAFFSVVERDARDSLAAIDVVRAQPHISSQLVDNLNASIHLRALLTDVFLLGDILK